jgi:hypothetical protein
MLTRQSGNTVFFGGFFWRLSGFYAVIPYIRVVTIRYLESGKTGFQRLVFEDRSSKICLSGKFRLASACAVSLKE